MSALLALLAALFLAQDAPDSEPFAPETPPVAIALTDEEVRVTSGFTGAELVIYGVAPGYRAGDDLVVILRGPPLPLTVMRKERVAGMWLNSEPASFAGAPSFYAAASTRPLSQIAPPDILRRVGASAEFVPLRTTGVASSDAASQISEYRRAIVRLKARDGLYRNEPGEVTLQTANLFRAEVRLPAQAPVGQYDAQVILFRDGAPIAETQTTLSVEKAGMERIIFDLAHEQSWLYGIACILMALLAGWGAASIFSRR